MPNVIVNSPVSVTVDGTDFGAVADAIVNNPQIASDVQAALVAYDAAQKQAVATVQTAFDQYKAVADQAIAVAEAAAADKTLTDAQFKAKALQALQIATTPAVERRRQELLAQKAKLEADLAALPKSGT